MTILKAPLLSRVVALLITVGGIGGFATTASSQSLPTTLDRALVGAQAAPVGDQAAALKAFVTGWSDQLATASDAKKLEEARRTLIEPLRDPAATAVFRRAFAAIALPKLAEVMGDKDAQRAIHAMQVVRFIRTTEAVELLSSRLPTDRESDAAKRLAAASVLGAALSDADLNQPQFDTVIRAIVAAADRERDPLVILQELRALSSIAKRVGSGTVAAAPAASVAAARDAQGKVLRGLIDSLASASEADPRMATIHTAVIVVRNQLVDMSEPERKKLGPTLAPTLLEVLTAARKHWDSAHADPRMKSTYADAVTSSETLLRIVDRASRPGAASGPDKVFSTAWEKNTPAEFDAELGRWKTALADKAYH